MLIKRPFTLSLSKLIVCCFTFLGLISCTSYEFEDVNGDIKSIQHLHTYSWSTTALNEESEVEDTLEFNQLVHSVVDEIMRDKGYQLVDAQQADFLLDYRLRITQKVMEINQEDSMLTSHVDQDSIHSHGLQWGFDKNSHVEFSGWKDEETEVIFYNFGTIFLGAFETDVKEGKQAAHWIKRVSKILKNKEPSDTEKQENVTHALKTLLSDLPKYRKPAHQR